MSQSPQSEVKTEVSTLNSLAQDDQSHTTVKVVDPESVPSPAVLQPEPPNQGLRAWLTVLAGFFIYLNTW